MRIAVEFDVVEGRGRWPLLEAANGSVDGPVDVAMVTGTPDELAEVLSGLGRFGMCWIRTPRQTPTRITKYYGLWGHSPLGRNPGSAVDLTLAEDRPSGTALVPADLLADCIEFAADQRGLFLFITDEERNGPDAKELVDLMVDPEAEGLIWGEIVRQAIDGGWTAVRCYWDDRWDLEVSIFDTRERLKSFGFGFGLGCGG